MDREISYKKNHTGEYVMWRISGPFVRGGAQMGGCERNAHKAKKAAQHEMRIIRQLDARANKQ